MEARIVDIYAKAEDRTPEHRAIAQGATEEDALRAASEAYPDHKLVVSVGRALLASAEGKTVRQLW